MAAYSEAEQKLAQLLKQLRIERGLTQVELAEKVGEPQQVISKIERGHRRLYATQLFSYLQAGFGMGVQEFAIRFDHHGIQKL